MNSILLLRPVRCLALLILTASALVLISCGPDAAPSTKDGPVVVTFWHAMGRDHSIILTSIIREFEAENPDIRINAVYQGGYNSLLTNLIASNTAGTAPVMSQMYESWTTRFLERNLVIPVEDLAEKHGGLTPEDRKDIVSVFLEDSTWNGRLVTLPFNKSAYVLFYNRDAMKEIGMTDSEGRGRPPETWSEFRKACSDLTVKSDDEVTRYGFGVRTQIESFTMFYFRTGGNYMNSDGSKLAFDNPEARESMSLLAEIVNVDHTGYVEPGYLSTAFGNEAIAMYTGTNASIPFVVKAVGDNFDWDTAPIPCPEGYEDKARTLFQGTNVGIFRNHSPEKLEAAWRFLRFLTGTRSAAVWATGTGYLPIRYSTIQTDIMRDYLAKNPRYQTSLVVLDNGAFEPRVITWEPMRNIITDNLEAALNGRRSPEESVDTMLSRCQEILDTF
ncbi:MAG TPA: ABC transporter substrate-binding protein [Candidatus Sumerlaeota bacterium]|nr:ABC transporter substrate-binding protein [Candidatus Sumerlaeota bacterium]